MRPPFVNDMTVADASSPMFEEVNRSAAALLVASQELSAKLRQPQDTDVDQLKNTIAAALQAVVRLAHNDGATDETLFSAIAVGASGFARNQRLSPNRVEVVNRLGQAILYAANLGDHASQTGFPTKGSA